jgi:hypothetical protein
MFQHLLPYVPTDEVVSSEPEDVCVVRTCIVSDKQGLKMLQGGHSVP